MHWWESYGAFYEFCIDNMCGDIELNMDKQLKEDCHFCVSLVKKGMKPKEITIDNPLQVIITDIPCAYTVVADYTCMF